MKPAPFPNSQIFEARLPVINGEAPWAQAQREVLGRVVELRRELQDEILQAPQEVAAFQAGPAPTPSPRSFAAHLRRDRQGPAARLSKQSEPFAAPSAMSSSEPSMKPTTNLQALQALQGFRGNFSQVKPASQSSRPWPPPHQSPRWSSGDGRQSPWLDPG